MSLSGFRIAELSEMPHVIDCLVDWHHAEWMATADMQTMSAESIEKARHDRKVFMQTHATDSLIPTTFIGLHNDEPIASASVIFHDHEKNQKSVWLTNVYVVVHKRRQRLGEIMVQHAMQHCHKQHLKWLQLYTFDAAEYYMKRGWDYERTSRIRGRDVDILKVNTNQRFELQHK